VTALYLLIIHQKNRRDRTNAPVNINFTGTLHGRDMVYYPKMRILAGELNSNVRRRPSGVTARCYPYSNISMNRNQESRMGKPAATSVTTRLMNPAWGVIIRLGLCDDLQPPGHTQSITWAHPSAKWAVSARHLSERLPDLFIVWRTHIAETCKPRRNGKLANQNNGCCFCQLSFVRL
jgi:hypothetical protein